MKLNGKSDASRVSHVIISFSFSVIRIETKWSLSNDVFVYFLLYNMCLFSLIKDYLTTFEDLSNELIYEIFKYIRFNQTFQSFYDLNQRFQNLFLLSNISIKINIFSTSKSRFQRYFRNTIIPKPNRIQSMELLNPFADNMFFFLFPIMKNVTPVKRFTSNNIQSNYINEVFNDHFLLTKMRVTMKSFPCKIIFFLYSTFIFRFD